MSLRTVLLGLALIAIIGLPIGLYSYSLKSVITDEMTGRALNNGSQIAEITGVLIEQHFNQSISMLESYALRFRFREAWARRDMKEVASHLEQAHRLRPEFQFFSIYETDGTMRGIFPPEPTVMDKNYSFRDWYRGVSTTWKPYVSEVYKTAAKPYPAVVAVTVPIFDERGEKVGILMAPHTVETILAWMAQLQKDRLWTITIVDQGGNVMAGPGASPTEAVKFADYGALARARKGESGSGRFNRSAGGDVFAAFVPIPARNWVVIAEQPAAQLDEASLRPVRQIWWMGAFFLVLALCGVAVFAFIYYRMDVDSRFFMLSNEMCCVAGFDGYFKRVNPAWEKCLGYKDNELTSKPFMDFVHPDDRAATAEAAGRLANEHGELASFENRYRCKDGTYRWLLWTSAVVKGKPLIMAVARDITERKETEEQIKQLNSRLRDDAVLLDAANRELEAFSYSVSHDLRSPLRSIDGFSQALLEDCGETLDASGKDHLKRVRAGVQRMGLLIDDLLKLARVTRVEMNRADVDMSALAGEVAAGLSRADPERKTTIRIQPGLIANGDAGLLRVIFDNLLGNAWKFTSKQQEAVIEVGAANGEFFVKDNGAGFDMTYASKLFGAFQRLHSPSEFPGTGIGLATVQRVVRRHGGSIRAEGIVGKGAAFYFTLDRADAGSQ